MLTYSAITSLDGYVNDETGGFEWAAPDEQLHAFVNELERPIGCYLYGRRMYETMRFWATPPSCGSEVTADFARIWQAADKVVFSATLDAVDTPRTRLERRFDPDTIRQLKGDASVSVGGPTLAAAAFAAGLVDDVHLLLTPVAVGGGTPALPRQQRLDLELLDQRRFDSGVIHLHYRVGDGAAR